MGIIITIQPQTQGSSQFMQKRTVTRLLPECQEIVIISPGNRRENPKPQVIPVATELVT